MTDRKDFPQYNPTKSSLWNFKYAYEQGKSQREKEILEIIEELIKKEEGALTFGKSITIKNKKIRRTNSYIQDKLLLLTKIREELKSKIKNKENGI